MKPLLYSLLDRSSQALRLFQRRNTLPTPAGCGVAPKPRGIAGQLASVGFLAAMALAVSGSSAAAEALSPPGWGETYDQVVDWLAERYPFTEHKGIDWAQVRTEFRPALLEAEKAGDPAGAYVAWRRFVHGTLHDGHVTFWALPGTPAAEAEDAVLATITGGSYGIEVVRCDDGTVLVVGVDEAAAAQGLVFGARLFEWNGRPVAEALAQTDLVWAPTFGSRESAVSYTHLTLPTSDLV